jgi:hypothetical protein
MKRTHLSFSALAMTACLAIGLAAAGATQVKKQFVVEQDRGRDILCDPYIVKKNDYLLKVFRQRGEIAIRDLPQFLEIFKRINSEVEDVNLIYPNQKILIPLKILEPGSLEGQETGVVAIPMIIISNITDELMASSFEHIVVQGDTVSSLLVPHFGRPGSLSYDKGIEIFKYLNPEVKDINNIHVGQKLRLPDPAISENPWYAELFDASGRIALSEAEKTPGRVPAPIAVPEPREIEELAVIEPLKTVETSARAEIIPATVPETPGILEKPSSTGMMRTSPQTLFEKAARIFRADLIDSGEYFFPRKGQPEFKLDLSVSPVMEFRSGKRVLYAPENRISAIDADIINMHWKNVNILKIPAAARLHDLLDPICPVISGGKCDDEISLNDGGVSVALRADYIYDNPGGRGKVYLVILDHPDQALPATFRVYLEGKGILVSEWIDNDGWFGAADRYGVRQTRAADTRVMPAASPEGVVRRLADLFGCTYQEKVDIAFSYAGFQVKTRADMLTTSDGRRVLADYGDLRGEAIKSLEKEGFAVVQFDRRNTNRDIVQTFLTHLSIGYEKDPTFWVAERPRIHNPSIHVPGMMVVWNGSDYQRILFSEAPVPSRLDAFFVDAGIHVIALTP